METHGDVQMRYRSLIVVWFRCLWLGLIAFLLTYEASAERKIELPSDIRNSKEIRVTVSQQSQHNTTDLISFFFEFSGSRSNTPAWYRTCETEFEPLTLLSI